MSKVLRLDIIFKLSDSFSGDLNEALMEIIEYRKNNNIPRIEALRG